ncbi:MAG TPA: hypothetical protein VF653_13195 [Methylomirabilota bacterium]
MSDDKAGHNRIAECALRQNREGTMASMYAGPSEHDRIALARMTTDIRDDNQRRWSQPADDL